MWKTVSRRHAVAIGISALVAAMVVVGLVGAAGREGGASPTLGDGPPVPELSGADPVTGAAVSTADFRGRPLIINMWASWCPGCSAEAPDIRRFTQDHPEIAFLGIAVTDTDDGARAFVSRHGWTHPSISDPRGRLAARLNLRGLPTTVFVRADGTIAGETPGEITYRQLVDAAAELRS